MTSTESIELARAYVALSNAHRVDLITPMFAEDARYHSSAVGEFLGPRAISGMMHGFFARYPDVYWQCEHYQSAGNIVSFDFQLSASATADDAALRRSGHERIAFNDVGLIIELAVAAS